MNQYHLKHVTEFHYDGPVSESYNEVRLRPMHDDRQSCLSFRLSTSASTRATAYRDWLGNWVHQFNVLPEHRHLAIHTDSVVMTHEAPPSGGPPVGMTLREFDSGGRNLCEEYFDFVAPTGYVPHLAPLQNLVDGAAQAADDSVAGFVQGASDLIHQSFRYVKGATHVSSSIEHSLALGAGVCQDFAHLLLGVVRKRGLPARYVSGYVIPRDAEESSAVRAEVIGGQASHAWVEVYVPGAGWSGLDPTLGEPVGPRHIRVAYGRDYGDVAPVRGVYRGHAGQRLSVDVLVCPVLDDNGHEQLQKSAARPAEASIPDRPQQPEAQQQQQQ